MAKEAKARIRINKYLEDAGWRFFDSDAGFANICLETNVKITEQALNDLSEDFEKTKNGLTGYILLWLLSLVPRHDSRRLQSAYHRREDLHNLKVAATEIKYNPILAANSIVIYSFR